MAAADAISVLGKKAVIAPTYEYCPLSEPLVHKIILNPKFLLLQRSPFFKKKTRN
jgi:hypothetical protein